MPIATPKPDTKSGAAPRHACTFVRQGAVTFGDTDGEKDNQFQIVLSLIHI